MSELARLRDGADPEWRELLRYTKDTGTPSPERVDALAARVVAELSAPSTTDDAAAATARASRPALIWVLGMALIATLSSFGVLHVRRHAPHAPSPVTPPVPAAPAVAPPAQPSPSLQEELVTTREEREHGDHPAVPRPRVRRARGAQEASRPSTQATHSAPTAEIALLKSARRALETDPEAALALVEQHMREHPRGVFVQEREALAVEALWRVGDGDRASARLRAMLATYPRSTYRERLSALLAGPPAPR